MSSIWKPADQVERSDKPFFDPLRPVIVICGPTASGKSALALALAETLDGEIVSADSMQIYRGMNIGTAKVSLAEQVQIPHHLIDVCHPSESFSVAQYKQQATAALQGIYQRGRQPILCGGTGQYLSALTEGLTFIETPADPALRRSLQERAEKEGLPSLWQELSEKDARAAAKISEKDAKRIIRALEVIRQTGLTPTEINMQSRIQGPDFSFRGYVLTHARPVLYERINGRVVQMFQDGLTDEVRQLLEHGCSSEWSSFQAIGYKETVRLLRGEWTGEQTIAAIQQATRRYAKRQLTWFRAMQELDWLSNRSTAEAVQDILR